MYKSLRQILVGERFFFLSLKKKRMTLFDTHTQLSPMNCENSLSFLLLELSCGRDFGGRSTRGSSSQWKSSSSRPCSFCPRRDETNKTRSHDLIRRRLFFYTKIKVCQKEDDKSTEPLERFFFIQRSGRRCRAGRMVGGPFSAPQQRAPEPD